MLTGNCDGGPVRKDRDLGTRCMIRSKDMMKTLQRWLRRSWETLKNDKGECAYHRPVLLKESIEGLNIDPKGIYVDLTFGGGGHSARNPKSSVNSGKAYAFDQDQDAITTFRMIKAFDFIHGNFRFSKIT